MRDSHCATQDRPIVDHDAVGFNVTCEFTGAPDLDELAGFERASHLTTNDNFSSFNFRPDSSVWADCKSPTGDANLSFELALQEQITVTGDLSFDLDALTHGGWHVRRMLRRRNKRRRSAGRGFSIAVLRFAPHSQFWQKYGSR